MDDIWLTRQEMAPLVGLTYRRLKQIEKNLPESGKFFVEGDNKKCSLSAFIQAWTDYNISLILGKTNGDGELDLLAEKAKHEVIKTEKTRLEVERMRGNLIATQDAKKIFGDLVVEIKMNFLNMPKKVAPMLLGMENAGEITGILEDEIRGILTKIAESPLPEWIAEEDKNEEEEDEEA